MKAAVVATMALMICWPVPAQSPYAPVAPARPRPLPQPLPVVPIVPPAFLPIQTNIYGDIAQNPYPADTNQFTEAALPPIVEATNTFLPTNAMTPAYAAALALTNRLSVMAPAQVQSVIQVQVSLNSLQDMALNIAGAQNVQLVILQNPQVQQQLHQCSSDILSLARGPARPSGDSVDRLSVDLLRACARGRLNPDQQLVLAIVVNLACNSQNMTAVQIDEAINYGLITLRTAGVPPAFSYPIGCDLRAIAFELQPDLEM